MFFGSLFSLSLVSFFAKTGSDCLRGGFFGLKPWYYYMNFDDQCNPKDINLLPANGQSDLLLIMLAVIDDLLVIAGIVAVAFVIIGAFKFVGSQGDPEGTANAQSTIINALLGVAIAITAAIFVNFLGRRLGG